MVDPLLLTTAIVLSILFVPHHWIMLAIIVCFFLFFLLAMPMLIVEGAGWHFGSAPTRAILKLRWPSRTVWGSKKSILKKLVKHYGLTLDPASQGEKERLAEIVNDVQRVNIKYPSVWANGLTCADLTKTLCDLAGTSGTDTGKQYDRLVQKAWPFSSAQARDMRSYLRPVKALVFRLGMEPVREKAASALAMATLTAPDVQNHPEFRRIILGAAIAQSFKAAGFPFEPGLLPELPLNLQRRLVAVHRTLFSGSVPFALTLVVNPSIARNLWRLRRDRRANDLSLREQAAKQTAFDAAPKYNKRGTLTGAQIEGLLDRNAVPAILLRRIWPIGSQAPGRSWLGGLPCLPDAADWPRHGRTNLPLHFLAQIDCAEVPATGMNPALPHDGLLLFFADVDEEMSLCFEGNEDIGATRVIYVPASERASECRAPDDLPEIGHSDGQMPSIYGDGRRIYPKWPVTAHLATNYQPPSAVATDMTSNPDYFAALAKRHEKDLEGVIVQKSSSQSKSLSLVATEFERDDDGKVTLRRQVFRPENAGAGFPFAGVVIAEILASLRIQARNMQLKAEESRHYAVKDPSRQERALAEVVDATAFKAEVEALAAATRNLLPLTSLTPDHCGLFIGHLATLAAQRGHQVESGLCDAFMKVAQRSVTEPALRDILSDEVMASLEHRLAPRIGQSQHFLMGTAQFQTNSTELKGQRLLVLDSDYGVDFMFCDCGVIEYWIDPDDLANRRFERARATSAGG